MENVKNAVKIAKHKYPTSSYTVGWIFDQSGCHKAYTEDALNVKRICTSWGCTAENEGYSLG